MSARPSSRRLRFAFRAAWVAAALVTNASHAQVPVPAPVPADTASAPATLSLAEALGQARQHQPTLRQAVAQAEATSARSRQALAPMLPQLSLGLGYQRSTAEAAGFDPWSANLGLSATLWDFGRSLHRYQASRSTTEAQASLVASARRTVGLAVRTAYYLAVAQKELVEVARATLANTEAHLRQVQGFVGVGTRPEIDLAQSRAERANAKLALVNATTGYTLAKARLNQAMGVAWTTTYEVADPLVDAVEGEDKTVDELLLRAVAGRPEIAAVEAQVRAQAFSVSSAKAGFWPILAARASLGAGSTTLQGSPLVGAGGVTLTWPLFEGGLTPAQVRESEAGVAQLEAQRDALVQQVRFEVEEALIGVTSSLEAVGVAQEAEAAARERLKLAEGRYRAGAGSVIELGDAQVAFTAAAAQRVQAGYALALARAKLEAALGGGEARGP